MSKTNWSVGLRSSAAAESSASTGSTSKKRPKTVFSATNAEAIPALEAMNCRRLIPRRRALRRAVSATSAATCFCSSVWSSGRYSSFDTTRVGSGENPAVSTSCTHLRVQRRELIASLRSARFGLPCRGQVDVAKPGHLDRRGRESSADCHTTRQRPVELDADGDDSRRARPRLRRIRELDRYDREDRTGVLGMETGQTARIALWCTSL